MKRREFITLLGGAATWAVPVRAQNSARPIVGFLHVAAAKPFAHIVAGFRQGLKETGNIEGQNVAIEFRWAEGQVSRLPEMAADLVNRHVAVLVTGGGEASAFAAKAATSTIPIVFNIGNDPVKVGLVTSLSRPGGNVTGVNILTTELEAKRLGLLHQMVPTASMVAHLVNPTYPPTQTNVRDVAAAARSWGYKSFSSKPAAKAKSTLPLRQSFKSELELSSLGPTRFSTVGAIRSWRWRHATPFLRSLSSASLRWLGA